MGVRPNRLGQGEIEAPAGAGPSARADRSFTSDLAAVRGDGTQTLLRWTLVPKGSAFLSRFPLRPHLRHLRDERLAQSRRAIEWTPRTRSSGEARVGSLRRSPEGFDLCSGDHGHRHLGWRVLPHCVEHRGSGATCRPGHRRDRYGADDPLTPVAVVCARSRFVLETNERAEPGRTRPEQEEYPAAPAGAGEQAVADLRRRQAEPDAPEPGNAMTFGHRKREQPSPHPEHGRPRSPRP